MNSSDRPEQAETLGNTSATALEQSTTSRQDDCGDTPGSNKRTLRNSIMRKIARLEDQRRAMAGTALSEDEEKRWLYEQMAALQQKIRRLESGQDGGASDNQALPASEAATKTGLEQIDREIVRLRQQVDAMRLLGVAYRS
ncbi:uncharacterized protein LOC119097751 [Pollicipes pollicipes]|uniref:uncharacterized protein LOC119097751 n=1 Tax=Pollicipes pollicipes TaxID=41117 RepID=UPI00188510A1|nr:uncharacterized protein LOC119097751 [Pollicipes pollicipes]